jgi:hypothetical protein
MSTDETFSDNSRLKIEGTGTITRYSFEVSGDLNPVSDTIEPWDETSGSGAVGWVTDTTHIDEYDFTGEITSFEFLLGEAEVYVDGERYQSR